MRDTLRRKLIDGEAVRVLARKGRTLITENALGLVQAAAGVDGSNVGSHELALLPRRSGRQRRGVGAPRCANGSASRSGSSSPTPWAGPGATAQTDVAIGAAGLTVLHAYAGAHDEHGNELIVTEVAVADEIAAAADLVKGKLTAIPVAVVRGLALRDDGSTARDLVRAGDGGPVLAGHRGGDRAGPLAGPAAAPLGAAVRAEPVAAGADRGRGRRGADRTRAAPHPAGALRLAADTGPGAGCWTG